MLSRFSRILTATTLLAMSASVFSEQVVLYGREEFRGRNLTITRPAPDLDLMGFENRAASIYVMSGTWEFCTETHFRGECRIYAPGEYRDLGDQTKRISSARLVNENPRSDWRNSGGARAELFDRENFSGPLATLREAVPNFGPLGYNDKVASIIIRRGTWEFCSDNRFSGECRIFGPGEYPRLGGGEDDRYSSARPIQQQGPDSGNPPPAINRARIRLFEFPNFAGRSITLDRQAPNFDPLGFNDRAESVIVEGGFWTLCSDANRGGQCRELRTGQYPAMPAELNSRVSSAYPR